MESGILYVIFNEWIRDPETDEMPYKIGITKDSIENRYYGLGIKMPGEFETLFAYKISDYTKAEQTIHYFYDEFRINGEWFNLSENELNIIKEKCEEMDGILMTDEISNEIETEVNYDSRTLEEIIRTIGMKTFVQYYHKLKNDKPKEIIQYMKLHEKYEINSIRNKVSTGKRIFRENLEIQALEIISKAEKVEHQIREEALKIINNNL